MLSIFGENPNLSDTSTHNLNLKGKWLREAEFDTSAHMIDIITGGCNALILGNNEVDKLKHKQEILH